jgi:AraC-like DNA-binding protein
MASLTRSAAPDPADLGACDRTRFWREPGHGDLECLSATFVTHRFPLHSHETYVVGVQLAGCNAYQSRGARRYAAAGDLCLLNPGDVHDGGAYGDSFSYRMSYPSVALLSEILADATGKNRAAPLFFRETLVRDAEVAAWFRAAHEKFESGGDRLAADACLVAAYGLLLLRHADACAPARLGQEAPSIERARHYLNAHFAREIELRKVAEVARLSPFHFLRAFRRETGLTPHAYLTNRRVNAARNLLGRGDPLADVALACGFFDQSHLSRVFKAHTGVTPGAYRATGGRSHG